MVKGFQIAVHTKIFSQDRLWNMGQPIGEEERPVLGECAFIKDEEEFSTVWRAVLRLNGVWETSWKIPEISFGLVVNVR